MLSQNITKMRKMRGLTQVELAKILHVTQSAVSHWESGRSIPDTVQLFQIAEFFGVSIDDLKAETIDKPTKKDNNEQPTTPIPTQEAPAATKAYKGMELYAKLNDENKAQVLQYMEFLMHKQ